MDRIIDRGENHQSYRGIPALAGIARIKDVIHPGLSVDDCVARLKRYHYTLKRLHGIFMAQIAAEPVYELKMAFSLHSYYCAEHVAALRVRVGEMREPPLGLDAVPSADLEVFFDEILQAPSGEQRLFGIYGKALPALIAAMRLHIRDTNMLADHPSFRVCRFALVELEEMTDFGQKTLAALLPNGEKAEWRTWLDLLDTCLARAGGLAGADKPSTKEIVRIHSAKPFVYDRFPKRDERFKDPYNGGVNAEAFLYDEKFPPEPKVLMMFYKRLREIDVPEMMASIIFETKDKPWAYYRDMTRQLWDEARHAMMGQIGFISAGVDWTSVPVQFTWSLGLNTQLKPIERHAVLYYIEQGLMPKTGKRFEWEVGVMSRNPMAALFQDYDWADEVLHAQIGRNWYVKDIGDTKKATDYGDECWSRVLMSWSAWKDEGLTEHRNWWPGVYAAACRSAGIEPDPKVLGYNTNYNNVRADLRTVSASG